MRLLIVDPDRDQVEMLMSWLKTLGYEVYRAYSGERARLEWEEQKPDLVLLDIQLPDVDGFEVATRLAAARIDAVVVQTSTRDACDFGSRITTSHAAGFLPKAELSGAALRRYLARAPG